MAVSSELGLNVVITGVSQVISGLKSIDNAASGLGTVLKGVGKVGSGALKLLTAPLRAIGKVAGVAWKGLTAVAKSIWRIGEYVVGNLIARGITAIGSAIVGMAKAAVQGAADMQLMQVSIEGLLARELMRGDLVTQTSTSIRHMTEAERLELDKLTLSYGELGIKLGDAEAEFAALGPVQGAMTAEQLAASITVRELRGQYAEMGAQLENLQGIEGSLITTEEELRVNTMSSQEAYALLASEEENRAEALTKELMMLALISPYQMGATSEAFRLAMAYGMASDKAIPFTEAILDTAAGLGMTNQVMERFVYNLAQAVIGGDLTGINLRQLSLTSFNLAQVLRDELGLSIEEVREQLKSGQLTLEEVSDAFVHNADVVWAGAAERSRNTWTGFKNSLEDLNSIMGALIIEPSLDAIAEAAVPLFDAFIATVESGTLERIGEDIATIVENGLGLVDISAPLDQMPLVLETIALLLEGRWEDAWYTAMAAVQNVFGDEAMAEVHQYKDKFLSAINVIKALLEGDFATAWEETKNIIIGVFGPEAKEPIALFEQAIAAIGMAIEVVKDILAGDIGLRDFVSPAMVEVIEAFEGVLGKIGDWFSEHGPDVKQVADNIFKFMMERGKALAKDVLPWLAEELEKWGDWMEENGPLIEKVVIRIMASFVSASDKIGNFWAMVEPTLTLFMDGLRTVLTFVMQVFVGDFEGAWETLQLATQRVWLLLYEIVSTNVALVVEVVGEWLDTLREWWGEKWEVIKEKFGEIWQAIVDAQPEWLTELYDNLTEKLQEMWQAIVDYVQDFWDAGADLIEGMIGGVKSKAQELISAARGVVSGAIQAAKNLLGIESPSTVFLEIGQDLVQGLINGVESKAEEFEDVVKGLFDVASTLSGVGSFFSGRYEAERVDPLRAQLKEMDDNMKLMAEHKRGLEEQIEAEQEQAIRDAAALEIEELESVQDEREKAIEAVTQANKEALNDLHTTALRNIAEEFGLKGDEIKRLIGIEEDEAKTRYSDESDAIKDRYDEEERLFKEEIDRQKQPIKDRYDEEERLIKEKYDEEVALYNDAMDIEKRAIRSRDDLEEEEKYQLLNDLDTKARADARARDAAERAEKDALHTLEDAELKALNDARIQGIDDLGNAEDAELEKSIAAKEQALADIQAKEEDKIRALAKEEQDAIDAAIDGYQERIDAADETERVALENLIAQSEAQKDAVTQRMEEEIALIEVQLAATEQEVRAEEIRLDLIKQIEEEEARILELKEKQDQLKMLEQQRKLLELISEYELDAGSILDGLTLGLEADAGDVLDAMVGAMTGIIGALEDTLEISSPSGVFRTIGQQMMGGMAQGVADLTPAVIAQINAAVSPVMGGGGGVTNIYNNTNQPAYNLTTQSITRPGALALEFDAMAMASR